MASGSFTIWQLPEQTTSQMMSYVVRTSHGKIIAIDGGTSGDAAYLARFLMEEQGGHVHAWFVTHHHYDHIDALSSILEGPKRVTIDTVYESRPDEDWTARHDPVYLPNQRRLKNALRHAQQQTEELALGQVLEIDGLRIEVLGIRNPEIEVMGLNNQSVALRLADARKSVLFPGDLHVEGGDKLLAGPYRDRLRADIVQMAHHGQAGVSERFYQAVRPTCCLWPTPRWLWENNAGQGPCTGPWLTLQVREWMARLGVREHHVSADGLCRID